MRSNAFALAVAVFVVPLIAGCVVTGRPVTELSGPLDMSRLQLEAGMVVAYITGELDAFPPGVAARASQVEGGVGSLPNVALMLRGRHAAVLELKRTKVLGEDNRGYVELRSSEGLAAEVINEVQKLVHAENTDRKNLYKEIARVEGRSDVTLTLIEHVYAMDWLRRARPGEWVQLPGDGNALMRVRTMDIGKRLGDACQPEAWVAVP